MKAIVIFVSIFISLVSLVTLSYLTILIGIEGVLIKYFMAFIAVAIGKFAYSFLMEKF